MVQSQRIAMMGLGVQSDSPPVDIQPPLVDGIHLRWGATRETAFPWYGYYLYRRPTTEVRPRCIQDELRDRDRSPGGTLVLSAGTLTSDVPLLLSDDFPPAGNEVDLAGGRAELRFAFASFQVARLVNLVVGFRKPSRNFQRLVVRARYRGVPVAEQVLVGKPGEIVSTELTADSMDELLVLPADDDVLPDAVLIELCYFPIDEGNGQESWKPVPDCPQPITLPLRHPDYPPTGNAPVDEPASEANAMDRITYGDKSAYAGASFSELHDNLIQMVVGGPAGPPMADPSRASDLAGAQTGPGAGQLPVLSAMHPLDLVLLASRHPAAAQTLGLYWVDRTPEPGVAYDYLLIADTIGGAPNMFDVLATWEKSPAGYEAFIVSDKKVEPASPLDPPVDVLAYALPFGMAPAPGPAQPVRDAAGLVGLCWTLPLVNGTLLPHSAVAYHLWRESLGDADTPAPSASLGSWLTGAGPVLVGKAKYGPFTTPRYPTDWPAVPLHRIDRVSREGWYGYRASGMDLFGRISPPSPPMPWRQWAPAPDPKPWYYLDPPSDAVVHPSAVRILDKTPPPPAVGVEASALDPRDPYLNADAVYQAWRAGLPPAIRSGLVGVRVRWRWTATQMRQAPDVREFRIYYNSGTTPPAPDFHRSTSWEQRVHVTQYAEAASVAADGSERIYDVLLPVPGRTVFAAGVPLTPTLAEPIVYAHVGVSAVDASPHTPDGPQWAAGAWGSRPGNEGSLGTPAKIFRVQRDRPPAPPVPPDAERVHASPADYSSHSFYTYRWVPLPHLHTHVFRAMDTSVFTADRALRPRPPLTAGDPSVFPDPAVEPRWDKTKRAQVSTELNGLNAFPHTPEGDVQAKAAYAALSNDSLRVLASLPGIEPAFSQITIVPLDGVDAATVNRPGPDNPPDFVIDPNLRIYIDTLDGRSSNRYFYRAAYVDGAHNRSALSGSGPPIWLPDVLPPRPPALTSVVGGERTIGLTWASNREADLVSYRVYRADAEADARDLRTMTLVGTLPVLPGDPLDRPAAVSWTDNPVPALVNWWYAVVAFDEAGNASTPSRIVVGRAYDEALPIPPVPIVAWVDQGGVRRAEISWTSTDEVMVQRREAAGSWLDVASWRRPGSVTFRDPSSLADHTYEYRLRVRKATGALALGAPVPLTAVV